VSVSASTAGAGDDETAISAISAGVTASVATAVVVVVVDAAAAGEAAGVDADPFFALRLAAFEVVDTADVAAVWVAAGDTMPADDRVSSLFEPAGTAGTVAAVDASAFTEPGTIDDLVSVAAALGIVWSDAALITPTAVGADRVPAGCISLESDEALMT